MFFFVDLESIQKIVKQISYISYHKNKGRKAPWGPRLSDLNLIIGSILDLDRPIQLGAFYALQTNITIYTYLL